MTTLDRQNEAWVVVAGEEFANVWRRGWGPFVLAGIAVVLSAVTIGLAYTTEINLLDAREGVAVIVRLSLGVGLLVALFTAADSISGRRDRSTLETHLLSPVAPRTLVAGSALTALSWWAGTFVVSLPYLWALGRGPGGWGTAIIVTLLLGVPMAIFLVAGGAFVSIRASSNLASLGTSGLALALLAAPMALPGAVVRGPVGNALHHIDPITAGLRLIDAVVVNEAPLVDNLWWFASPVAAALVMGFLVWRSAGNVELEPRS